MTKYDKLITLFLMVFTLFSLGSCSKDDDNTPIREGVERSELILTEVSGEEVEAHGDHFHGLNDAVEGESIVIKFDENGIATSNGHLHLEVDAIYKIELKAWDYNGQEVQHDFIASKAVADDYKAFLVGGDLILNPDSKNESGAIFQPREQQYGDGSAVNGQYETTGILSYFTVGHDNEGPTKELTYVLRKLDSGLKGTIERTDWNRKDYTEVFAGENVLELKFEVHAEEGHHH
ncbi:hypothetical protein H8S90_14310 [Olivibacter sp. SDN3]|uniref:hypothetical protein n=1 Tax=Olivibacter sp. SDN3 TaxID=2764720 RepID=UPI001650FE60|nr:hypothetical protein [Olivibacter sp. SDN3]QNL47983.1 hypothetical protein H8S90_14310 [Olivibacter sp. SDN3]